MSGRRICLTLYMMAGCGMAADFQPLSSGSIALLPDAVRGESYEVSLRLPPGNRCPSDTFWRVAGGNVPQGITADVNGVRGILRQPGEYQFVLEAVNNCGKIQLPVQLTVKAPPLLVVSSESIQLEAFTGSGPMTRHVLVGSNWPELPFSVISDAVRWLSVTDAAMTPAADSALSAMPIDIHIRPQDLQPGVYRAKLRVSAWSAANSPVIDVTLVVKAAAPPR